MRWLQFPAACLVFSAAVLCAQQIPSGTVLPAMLNCTLDAKKDKPGRKISARIMQDVPLPDGMRIPAGSMIVGHIVQVSAPAAASISRLVFTLDQLNSRGHSGAVAQSRGTTAVNPCGCSRRRPAAPTDFPA